MDWFLEGKAHTLLQGGQNVIEGKLGAEEKVTQSPRGPAGAAKTMMWIEA